MNTLIVNTYFIWMQTYVLYLYTILCKSRLLNNVMHCFDLFTNNKNKRSKDSLI